MPDKKNVYQQETEKFSTYGDSWWDTTSVASPLHRINPLRLRVIQQYSPLALNQCQVLDVGCGGGILSEALAREGATTLGIDVCESAIAAAEKHAAGQHLPLSYTVSTIEALAENQQHLGQYDMITCMEMLEHVPQPDEIIQHAATLLKPGGRLFVSTLNRTPKAFFCGIIGAEYILGMVPKGTHSYQSFIKPSELKHWAERAGFSYHAMTGIQYNPLTDVFSLGSDISINYLCVFHQPT